MVDTYCSKCCFESFVRLRLVINDLVSRSYPQYDNFEFSALFNTYNEVSQDHALYIFNSKAKDLYLKQSIIHLVASKLVAVKKFPLIWTNSSNFTNLIYKVYRVSNLTLIC
jgi:hypothetical protein